MTHPTARRGLGVLVGALGLLWLFSGVLGAFVLALDHAWRLVLSALAGAALGAWIAYVGFIRITEPAEAPFRERAT